MEHHPPDLTGTVAHVCISESPLYAGRADPGRARWSARSTSSGEPARTYRFRDVNGIRPDCWRYVVEVQDAGRTADDTGYR